MRTPAQRVDVRQVVVIGPGKWEWMLGKSLASGADEHESPVGLAVGVPSALVERVVVGGAEEEAVALRRRPRCFAQCFRWWTARCLRLVQPGNRQVARSRSTIARRIAGGAVRIRRPTSSVFPACSSDTVSPASHRSRRAVSLLTLGPCSNSLRPGRSSASVSKSMCSTPSVSGARSAPGARYSRATAVSASARRAPPGGRGRR